MPIFFHDFVLPDDPAGFSIWLQEHYLEHQQFVQIFQAETTPIFVPDYNFALWGDSKFSISGWLQAHQAAHVVLRQNTGVSGIDLADVDLNKHDEWYAWMDDHRAEHADIRHALGINI